MKRLLAILSGVMVLVAAAGQVRAAPILIFFVDGNTFSKPFRIDNTSTDGELVTRFQLELSGTGTVFDTVGSGSGPFTPLSGTEVTTGLSSVSVVSGGTLLDISFTGFDPSEFLSWDIDLDFSPGSVRVDGDDLIGASATIDFSDGQRLLGTLLAVPGNTDASEFTVTGITGTPGSVIPEPSSIVLFAIGGIGLLGYGWRRKRKQAA